MWTSAIGHAVIVFGIQMILWRPLGIWAAGLIPVAIFFGREIAQHEYKGGGPKVVVWYYGLINHWNQDSLLDIMVPLVTCILTAISVKIFVERRKGALS